MSCRLISFNFYMNETGSAFTACRFMLYLLRLNNHLTQTHDVVGEKNSVRYVFNILYSKRLGYVTNRRNPYRIVYKSRRNT